MPKSKEVSTAAPRHSENITGDVQLRIGNSVSLNIAVRTTPAGLVAVGVLVSSIILSVAPLVWAARRRP